MEQEGPALHSYLCPFRDTGKLSALIGLPGPSQNGALNDIDVVLIGAQFVFSLLQLRAWNGHLDSEVLAYSASSGLVSRDLEFQKAAEPSLPSKRIREVSGVPRHSAHPAQTPAWDHTQHATNRALTSPVFTQTSFACKKPLFRRWLRKPLSTFSEAEAALASLPRKSLPSTDKGSLYVVCSFQF